MAEERSNKIAIKPVRVALDHKLELHYRLYELEREHMQYLDVHVRAQYATLTQAKKAALEAQFQAWLKTQPCDINLLGLTKINRFLFLQKALLNPEQTDFECWARTQGFVVAREGKNFKIAQLL